MVAGNGEREGGHALGDPSGIADPVKAQPAYRGETLEHGQRQLPLVRVNGRHRGAEASASMRSLAGIAVGGAERLEIAERSDQPGERLVVLGADLPLARQCAASRPDAVRGQPLEELAPAVEHAEMWREELVRAGH